MDCNQKLQICHDRYMERLFTCWLQDSHSTSCCHSSSVSNRSSRHHFSSNGARRYSSWGEACSAQGQRSPDHCNCCKWKTESEETFLNDCVSICWVTLKLHHVWYKFSICIFLFNSMEKILLCLCYFLSSIENIKILSLHFFQIIFHFIVLSVLKSAEK